VRALGPALLLALLVLTGCGSDYATIGPENPRHLADGLVFTRADGSTYRVDDAVATCVRSDVTGTEYVYLAASEGHADFVLEVVAGVTGERQLPLDDQAPLRRLAGRKGPNDVSLLAADLSRAEIPAVTRSY
jgi:hypothetical protein